MNPANTSLKDAVQDQLIGLEGITVKAMFGGYSFYAGKKIFAIISDGKLFGKHNTGLPLFTYSAKGKTMTMKYFEVPEELLEDRQELIDWAIKCINITQT